MPPAPLLCAHMGVPGIVDPETFPFRDVTNAALAGLTAWVTGGAPPPHAAPIELTSTPPVTVARDAFGNALGGVRTPFLDVPAATYVPTDTALPGGSGFCPLYGYNIPFSHTVLGTLYNNHGDYVHRVVQQADHLVKAGFWLRPDAEAIKTQAAQGDVP